MNGLEAYKSLSEVNIQNTDFGKIFINTFDVEEFEDVRSECSFNLNSIDHFKIYDNMYFPFDRVSCVNITKTKGYKDIVFGSTTFIDNPEHKLTSCIKFECVSPFIGSCTGELQVYPKEEMNNDILQHIHDTQLDTIVLSLASEKSPYVIVMYFKSFANAFHKRNESVAYLRSLPNNDEVVQETKNLIDKVANLVGISFGYFVRMVVDTKQIECRYCNRLFTPSSSRNKYCSAECVLKSRISRIPPIEDLKRMIWEKPMVELAKDLGVSDNIIGKWCKKYNIDKPPTGYWNKLQYNR